MTNRSTTNIGILAHVDAGKTSLTERLLHATGAIGRLGRVDDGTTRTDTGAVERARGITIRTAVAPLTVHGRRINLVDTPGHADFVAEVERALTVLDGAVLVLSAVEGVQAQTRVLMAALRELRLPVLVFANKTDRAGARRDGLLDDMRRLLAPGIVDAARPDRVLEPLAEHDDALLADYVDGRTPDPARLRTALAEQTARGLVHPVRFGSALTGEGIAPLLDDLARLLPEPAPGRADGPPRGTVFAVEREPGSGERTALVRLDAGRLAARRTVRLHHPEPGGGGAEYRGRPTAVETVAPDGTPPAPSLGPGSLGRIRGLPGVRVGDRLGPPGPGGRDAPLLAHPGLESVVRPRNPEDGARLRAALLDLADQDPFIRARPRADGTTGVLLHGEVQREVLGALLAQDYGVDAEFGTPSPLYLERPAGEGESVHEMAEPVHPGFVATVGLRVEPAAPGTGVHYRLGVERGCLPRAFRTAVEETVHGALGQGLHGWPVTDCTVTLIRAGYASPVSTARHFRLATPVVLLRALARAGTRVHEPCHGYRLTVPQDALGDAAALLAGHGAEAAGADPDPAGWTLHGRIPARRVPELRRRLPGLAHGEALWLSRPDGDRPLARGAAVPERQRDDGNPLDIPEYLVWLAHGDHP